MAYGVKYELDFSDIKGNKRSVEILKKDYTGEIFSIVGTDSPVIIKYTNDDDFYNPIIGSSCVLNIKTTDTITYDEFTNFDEREYKVRVNIGVDDPQADINSPLWELADTNWEATDFNWAASTVFQVYWEGFLVSDTFREAIQSKPFDITLRAIDNLGSLEAYLVPDGNINTNADGTIKTAAGEQDNIDTAFYYLHKILEQTGLEFDIYIQNNIRRTFDGLIVSQNRNLFQDIRINEFSLMDNFAKKNAKEVLEEILRITNSRVYQANASWYVVSNSNYYDVAIAGQLGDFDQNQLAEVPSVSTNAVTNKTTTSGTLNGTIVSDKGLQIIERGFYYGTSPIYIQNEKEASTDTSSNFTLNISNLIEGETYYIQAYAKNNIFLEGLGNVVQYIPGESDDDDETPIRPVVQMQNINPYTVENDKMLFTGQFSNVGQSNVIEYGFYFGTDANNFNNNTQYPIATGVNISVATAFAGDTSAAPFNLTLASGQPFYINAYAKNSQGEGVSATTLQYTWNAWQLRKQSDNSTQSVPYTSDSRGDNVYLSTSSSSSDCYTIMVGQYLTSLSGLPTIAGACDDDTTEPTPSVEETCKEVTLYRSSTAFSLCCEDPTSRTAYINGESFTSSDTTKVFNNDACSETSPNSPLPAQYLSENLAQYRYWNGTVLGNVINCQDNSGVDVCDPDVLNPSGWLVQKDNSLDRVKVAYNSTYGIDQRVIIDSDSENCYTIIESFRDGTTITTPEISSTCNTQPPTPTQQCPTMTFFARYLLCGGDEIKIMGNNVDNFPNVIKKVSTNECWSFIDRTSVPTIDDEFNLGCFPTNKFTVKNGIVKGFPSCDDCLGVSTTTQVATTTTSTTQAIFYRQYIEIQSNCSDADQILEVSNTVNSFPNVITDGLTCFRNQNAGGQGQDGDVDNYIGFNSGTLSTDCASCNQYISTTTTQTPTTTQAPCKAISASVTTIALNACCGAKSTTIYINANNILLASVIYTDAACTTVLPAGNFINTGGQLYFWTGNTLVEQDCPQCP
jgi:hypothetical protein